MNLIKFALALVLLAGGYKWWHKHQAEVPATAKPVPGNTGFVSMPQPSGTDFGTVLIFAPINCPSDAAQRARDLSRELAARHIPHVQLEQANFDMADPPDEQTMASFNRVMEGTIPVVFVRGKGKANPALDEVIAEYSAARR